MGKTKKTLTFTYYVAEKLLITWKDRGCLTNFVMAKNSDIIFISVGKIITMVPVHKYVFVASPCMCYKFFLMSLFFPVLFTTFYYLTVLLFTSIVFHLHAFKL